MEPTLTSTLALLAATPATLDALLRHLPGDLTHAREGPGTWTVAQVLAHLIHGERTDWLPRVQIILQAGESETFPTFQREAHLANARSLPELLTEFAELRASEPRPTAGAESHATGSRTQRTPSRLRQGHALSTARHLAHA